MSHSFDYSPSASEKVTRYLRDQGFLDENEMGNLEKKSAETEISLLKIFLEENPALEEKVSRLIAHLSGHPFTNEIEKPKILDLPGFALSQSKGKTILLVLDPWHKESQTLAKEHGAIVQVTTPGSLKFEKRKGTETKSQVTLVEPQGLETADTNALVYEMLKGCILEGASDLHIDLSLDEKGQKGFKMRYRVDGECRDKGFYSDLMLYRGIVNKLKLDAGLKIDERRLPQDGRISFELNGKVHNFRLSFMPNTIRNSQEEKVVLRQMADVEQCDLHNLGILPYNLAQLETAIRYPHGFVCVTGPTGSGKTTLLYSMLQQIDRGKKNVITLEDPIEAEIPLVNQSQIFHRIGYDFAAGLRVILRQDPDIIMVGEMRDEETAAKAFEAANTGHLVFSTLHTNTAASSITRLLQMKVPHYFISSSLKVVVAQRLVRRLCADCQREHPDTKEVQKRMEDAFQNSPKAIIKLWEDAKKESCIFSPPPNGSHCARCQGTGYKGRMAIMEVMRLDDELRHIIGFEDANEQRLQQTAEKNGMLTIQQYGYLQAMKGLTSFEEVNNTVMSQ